jgi:hypothetical protein
MGRRGVRGRVEFMVVDGEALYYWIDSTDVDRFICQRGFFWSWWEVPALE